MSQVQWNNQQSDDLSFEAAFARLEEVLATLEAGNLPLDQAIALYEEGMRLAQQCQERLEHAELRITQLQARFGEPQPFYDENARPSEPTWSQPILSGGEGSNGSPDLPSGATPEWNEGPAEGPKLFEGLEPEAPRRDPEQELFGGR